MRNGKIQGLVRLIDLQIKRLKWWVKSISKTIYDKNPIDKFAISQIKINTSVRYFLFFSFFLLYEEK